MKKRQTTHQFLHQKSVEMLANDFNHIFECIRQDSKIQEYDISKMKVHFDSLQNYINIYIKNASEPDKKENKCYFEKYEFVHNFGMKVTKTRVLLPFIFSQHFFSAKEVRNYVFLNNIIDKIYNFKNQRIKDIANQINKQGLTFNAQELFLQHAKTAVALVENNDYQLDEESIRELSYASHYLEDMCEPHHATNKIGLGFFSFVLYSKLFQKVKCNRISNHTLFEKYAYKNKENFMLNSIKDFCLINTLTHNEQQLWINYTYDKFINDDLENRKGLESFTQACRYLSEFSSLFACGVIDYETGEEGERVKWALSLDKMDWDKNLQLTLPLAQLSVSVFLFIFLAYISNPQLFNYKELKI